MTISHTAFTSLQNPLVTTTTTTTTTTTLPPLARPYLTSAQLTGARYVLSFNKLVEGYSGDCIKVRRSSDNTTQNIGFAVDGTLDEASLLSFVGAGDGYIEEWYSQLNGFYVYLTNQIAQAQIVDSGVVKKVGNKVAPLFTDIRYGTGTIPGDNYSFSNLTWISNDNLSISAVITQPLNNQVYLFQTPTGGGWPTFIFGYNNGGVQDVEWYAGSERYIVSTSGMSTSTFSQISVTRNNTNVTAYFNGSQVFQNSIVALTQTIPLRCFMSNNNDGTNAQLADFILYDTDLGADMVGVNTNQVNYFGL